MTNCSEYPEEETETVEISYEMNLVTEGDECWVELITTSDDSSATLVLEEADMDRFVSSVRQAQALLKRELRARGK